MMMKPPTGSTGFLRSLAYYLTWPTRLFTTNIDVPTQSEVLDAALAACRLLLNNLPVAPHEIPAFLEAPALAAQKALKLAGELEQA